MKNLTLISAIAALGVGGFAQQAAAQYDRRIDVPSLVPNPADSRNLRGDYDRRLSDDLADLNRDVRRTREELHAARSGSRRLRDGFERAVRETDHLNAQYRQGRYDRHNLARKIGEVRSDLRSIREVLRH